MDNALLTFAFCLLSLSSASAQWNSNYTQTWRGKGQGSSAGGSPAYTWQYQNPLPIPPVAVPRFTDVVNGVPIEYYETTIKPFQEKVYPNLGPANLIGYNGTSPGPTYYIKRGTETVLRYLNDGSLSAVVHLHGSYTRSPWDGWTDDLVQPGQYKDYYYPNHQSARPIWFHDHANGHTSHNAYYGQGGMYIIYDPKEDALGLPSGKYDVVMALNDKKYNATGDLVSPDSEVDSFYGDIIQVNDQPWPYFAVEPRRYRLRFFDMSLSRPYQLVFVDDEGKTLPFQVIASDAGLFGAPVTVSELTIATGERYEVVFDFCQYPGRNITLTNTFQLPFVPQYEHTDEVMLFVVGGTVTDNSNSGEVPAVLNPGMEWPKLDKPLDRSFTFGNGQEDIWTINGISWSDVNNRILARPQEGTVELWELHWQGGPAVHPVHVHLVDFQIISRTGGSRGVLPYESAGLKDVVLLEPGETVQVLAYYGPWDGLYMFHCHNLIHEDHGMMSAFNVTRLQELGYDDASAYINPLDPRFAPKAYNAADYDAAAIQSKLKYFGNLGAYNESATLITANATSTKNGLTSAAPSTAITTPAPSVTLSNSNVTLTYGGSSRNGSSTWRV